MMTNKNLKQYVPKHLKRWRETVNYRGDKFDGYYVATWRMMRASPAERSNHAYITAHLQDSVPPEESHQIVVATFTDEVYSYRYYTFVHEDCERALKMADMFAKRVQLKGSLDPEGEQLEDMKSVKYAWKNAKLRARIRMCAQAGVSIFASRRDYPDGIDGLRIFQSLNETDYEAEELASE